MILVGAFLPCSLVPYCRLPTLPYFLCFTFFSLLSCNSYICFYKGIVGSFIFSLKPENSFLIYYDTVYFSFGACYNIFCHRLFTCLLTLDQLPGVAFSHGIRRSSFSLSSCITLPFLLTCCFIPSLSMFTLKSLVRITPPSCLVL